MMVAKGEAARRASQTLDQAEVYPPGLPALRRDARRRLNTPAESSLSESLNPTKGHWRQHRTARTNEKQPTRPCSDAEEEEAVVARANLLRRVGGLDEAQSWRRS